MADSIESLIYGEAQRGLALQPVLLNELRSRTGVLLAVTTATTAFLGGVVVDRGGIHAWGILVLAAFVVAVVCCLAVLWPGYEWTFFEGAKKLEKNYLGTAGEPWTLAQAQRDLAQHIEKHTDAAVGNMKTMQKWMLGAGSSLGLEVAFWLIELATN